MRFGISGHRDLTLPTGTAVGAGIQAALAPHAGGGLTGVSCLAAGADQLFAQATLDAGGALIVIVAAANYRDTVPAASHAAYDALLTQASEVITLPFADAAPPALMAAGLAMLDRVDHLIAVWDGLPARGPGGTAEVVAQARSRTIPVTILWPPGAERAVLPVGVSGQPRADRLAVLVEHRRRQVLAPAGLPPG